MAYTPFKMKGNPMQRNFGIGASPAKKGHKGKKETVYNYMPDPKRERTDARGRTQKEVIESRMRNERAYVKKVKEYEKKKGGLTEKEMKKARKKADQLSKRTVASVDSIAGVNKQLAKQAEKAFKKANKKRKKSTSDFDAATKMMKKSPAKMGHKSPSKMMKKSPAKKPLVGKQKNLPEELKKKILAAPSKMKKESAMKMKKKSAMKLKKSPAKMGHKKK